jgi:ATP-dependent DNA helicase RecQ
LEKLRKTLKEVFGYDQFRGNQEEIIKNVLDGNDSFVIMPTGAGKSLCYQLPAIILEGSAIVISPLIALMKNQVDQMNAFSINARFLNSTLTRAEINAVKQETLNGNLKLLYVAPESLTKPENIDFLKKANVSFAAIDEAHCISEWGHDFRPEYRKIRSILGEIGDVPIIALTATATPKVQQDIKKNLIIEEATIFKSSFNRPNLYYEVRPKKQVKKQLIKYIKEHKGKSGIIYCLSRKKVEEIAGFLKVNDIKAAPYHAGLEADVRRQNQDDFLNEEVDVIVATIAFGMGIDKPDVRFVIHYDTLWKDIIKKQADREEMVWRGTVLCFIITRIFSSLRNSIRINRSLKERMHAFYWMKWPLMQNHLSAEGSSYSIILAKNMIPGNAEYPCGVTPAVIR